MRGKTNKAGPRKLGRGRLETIKHGLRLNARMLAIFCCAAGLLATSYLGWALKRSSGSTMMAEGRKWPRPWPYPDEWLLRWHDKLDAAHPLPEKGIKMHGEWPRLHLYLLGWVSASLVLTVGGATWLVFCDADGVMRSREKTLE